MTEKTFVMIKPDGVQRNIIGKIITKFEDSNLKVIDMKMLQADKGLVEKHYPLDEKWAKEAFTKSKSAAEKTGREFPHTNHMQFGESIQNRLKDFLKEGPVVAMTIEGPHAVELVRKMVGHTEPRQAAPGTIRSDYASTESYALADSENRAVKNLIHASDSTKNAEKEIALWFQK